MITVVNRDYCKKLIAVLPKQNHPEQFHKKKEETFHVLYGDVQLYLDDKHIALKVGDTITINPNVKHSFTTNSGCVLEEISSTHFVDDSYYTDPNILKNKNRKTFIKNWH
jgi:quercetin dioxygenase-like cupin family protein